MDISDAFHAESFSIYDFFTRSRRDESLGFNIPQYQRPYSWHEDNIMQLIDDISEGVKGFLNDYNEIHFMGTVITIDCSFYENVLDPDKKRARPKKVEDIIDGQQRISTIALLSCFLYQRIFDLISEIPDEDCFIGLREAADNYLPKLQPLFSYKVKRKGREILQPIIVRESIDEWTLSNSYSLGRSDIFGFISDFIEHINSEKTGFYWTEEEFYKENKSDTVIENLSCIQRCFETIEKSSGYDGADYTLPPASEIVAKVNQDDFWEEPRDDEFQVAIEGNYRGVVATLTRYLMFSYFLLKRCCLTSIIPASELRAFDMFQSLNATGTPLTAIETFKPLVVNTHNGNYENSNSRKYFDEVESLFDRLTSSSSKNDRTNFFLILFENAYSGEKLGKQFSKQRKTLIGHYNECKKSDGSGEDFIWKMGRTATYCKKFIFSESTNQIFSNIDAIFESEGLSDLKREAALCILYIKESKHILAHIFLLRFYAYATLRGSSEEDFREFCEACKCLAAFFTLWRASLKGSYPDSEYRNLVKNSFPWKNCAKIDLRDLKQHLKEILGSRLRAGCQGSVEIRDLWLDKAKRNLAYDNSYAVCRFALFVSAHDTIPDPTARGLMKPAKPKTNRGYLDPQQWSSNSLATVEHIAPQNPSNKRAWDEGLYEDQEYHLLGNLTLLPKNVNSFAGNRDWSSKFIYYQYLAETDPDNFLRLREMAKEKLPDIDDKTLNILEECEFSDHVLPLIAVGSNSDWNKRLVQQRSLRMCEILYDRMYAWLS